MSLRLMRHSDARRLLQPSGRDVLLYLLDLGSKAAERHNHPSLQRFGLFRDPFECDA